MKLKTDHLYNFGNSKRSYSAHFLFVPDVLQLLDHRFFYPILFSSTYIRDKANKDG